MGAGRVASFPLFGLGQWDGRPSGPELALSPSDRTRAVGLTTVGAVSVASFPVVDAHQREQALSPTGRT